MDIISVLEKRYATKVFDQMRTLTEQEFQQVKDVLRLSPSSVNSQPWHFIIAESEEGKEKVAKSTQGLYGFNLDKVLKASHVIVFCARTKMDAAYLENLTEQENKDGRFATEEAKQEQHQKRGMFVDLHQSKLDDLPDWTTNQVFLNLGSFLTGVAALGLDAVPMEGFDPKVLDTEFDLSAQGLKAVVLVAIGGHAVDDFNYALPKSRLPEEEILTVI